MRNKKAQFDEISIVGIIGGVVGGMVSVLITHSMQGGLILKVLGFVITGVVCYFMASKIADG